MSVRRVAAGLSMVAALAVPSAVSAAPSTQAPAASAAKCTMATIAGKRQCLSAGKRCQRKYERQYNRYRFSCRKTTRRLVVVKQVF